MDSRERLARVLCCSSRGCSPNKSQPCNAERWHGWQSDKILASDWLRDTLAAERRAGFIAGRDAAAKVADRAECNPNTGNHMRATILHRIRNLEPEAIDEI